MINFIQSDGMLWARDKLFSKFWISDKYGDVKGLGFDEIAVLEKPIAQDEAGTMDDSLVLDEDGVNSI